MSGYEMSKQESHFATLNWIFAQANKSGGFLRPQVTRDSSREIPKCRLLLSFPLPLLGLFLLLRLLALVLLILIIRRGAVLRPLDLSASVLYDRIPTLLGITRQLDETVFVLNQGNRLTVADSIFD
jgi:hypothetical protein